MHLARAFFPIGVVLCIASTVFADNKADKKKAAQRYFESGVANYSAKKYDDAVNDFKAGYTLDQRPEFIFSLAQAYRLKGDYREAQIAYETFMSVSPNAVQAAVAKANADRCRAELEKKAAMDKEAAANREAEARTREAERANADAALARKQATPPWYKDKIGGALVGTGLGVAVIGAALLGVGASEISDANSASSYGSFQNKSSSASGASNLVIVGGIGVGVGAAVAIAGAARWTYLGLKSRGNAKSASAWRGNSFGAAPIVGGGMVSYDHAF